MPKYDLYTLGNALVDMEYQVQDDDLHQLNIDKGVMTLVDHAYQRDLMQHLDAYPHHRSSGGSAANSAIALSQLGGHGFHACKVAADELGTFYCHDLLAAGITTTAHSDPEAGDTGRCVVLVTPDTDRTMCTYLGVSSDLSERDLDVDALRDTQYFYTEGYLVTSPTARQTALTARTIAEQAHVKTALSLSDPNIVTFFRNDLITLIGAGVDFIFANEAEAKGLADTDDLQQAISYLRTLTKQFAITLGPRGALIFDGDALIEVAGVQAQAVDTLGAGDMFAGAFLFGLTHGWSHQRAGTLATAAAAQLVSSFGPRLDQETLRAVYDRIQA
jgi:sugar/nucleoside kinase (ribokinase family)